MRWWMVVALPVCAGFGMAQGETLPAEIGVLSCTLGQAIDREMSDQRGSASETRDVLCSFTPAKNGPEEAYAGALKSISAAGTLPDKVTLLWVVRAPTGRRPTAGLLQQSFAADLATPLGQTAQLVGERNNEITLHTMADKEEGSASKDQRSAPRFAITAIELKLMASTS